MFTKFGNDLDFRKNNKNRPYDVFLSRPALIKARQLRVNPTGEVHPIKYTDRARKRVAVYPWNKMELGDMFFAPVANRSLAAMRTTFMQASAKCDFEITILRINDSYGHDCLRVSVTAIGVYRARLEAYQAGYMPHPPSRGNYAERKAENLFKRRQTDLVKQTNDPVVTAFEQTMKKKSIKSKKSKKPDKANDPYWADRNKPPFEEPQHQSPADPLKYELGGFDSAGLSPEEKRARALLLAARGK